MTAPAASPQTSTHLGRSRHGYDARWWGDAGRAQHETSHDYWTQSRSPLASLCLVLPALLAYEIGVGLVGGPSPNLCRTGVDAWLRLGLATFGLTDRWVPPLALTIGLLAWHAADHQRRIAVGPRCLAGMLIESTLLAATLIGLSRVVDLGLNAEGFGLFPLQTRTGPDPAAARMLGFLGAGIYEEAIFRLLLIPLLLGLLRLLLVPQVAAGVIAVTGSSLLFSMAHHVGAPGESFTWFAFIFRWFAGVFFAWVFVVRGFGVAVGTHVAYDWLVGLMEQTAA